MTSITEAWIRGSETRRVIEVFGVIMGIRSIVAEGRGSGNHYRTTRDEFGAVVSKLGGRGQNLA